MTDTDNIPAGMVPMQGVFRYEDAEFGAHDLGIRHGQFTIYAGFAAEEPEAQEPAVLSLNILIAGEVRRVPAPDPQDKPMRLGPSLAVEWLTIAESALTSRDARALDGYRFSYVDARDDWDDRPAVLYQDGSAATLTLDLALDYRDGGYDLRAEGQDELQRRFHIAARLPLFEVMVRPGTGLADDARAEGWLARCFDGGLMAADWKRQGSAEHGWHDLIARFKGH